jgi:hypothetical protein
VEDLVVAAAVLEEVEAEEVVVQEILDLLFQEIQELQEIQEVLELQVD